MPILGEFRLDPQPVGLDEARLAAEAQALEQTLNRNVAIVSVTKDSMHVPLLEQFCSEGIRANGARPRHHAERLPTGHEDVLTAVVVERFAGESAIESFEAQPR